MGKIAIGTKITFVNSPDNQELHAKHPELFPAPGTTGTVLERHHYIHDYYLVDWEDGSLTDGHKDSYVIDDSIEHLVKEE